MVWVSKTRQFGPGEMGQIEFLPASEVITPLLASEPIVALRLLAEILHNGDREKLRALLADERVNAKWQEYETGYDVDLRDHKYADQLRKFAK